MRFALLLILISILSPEVAISAIDSVDITNGTITVTGSGFGVGPTVNLFETFSENGKLAGDASTAAGPAVGSWDSVSAYPIRYATDAKSGNFSGVVYGDGRGKQNTASFPPTGEVFISYWVKVPSGSCFSGTNVENALPTISAWKFVWLSDGQDGGNIPDDDLCIPSYVGNNSWMIAGNDYAYKYVSVPFVFGEWQRITAHLKADQANPSTANGTTLFQTLSETNGLDTTTYTDKPLFDADDNAGDNALFQWTHINIAGWLATGYTCPQPRYDDIYIATGSNASKRIEISNSPVYNNSSNILIQPSTSWSDNQVSAKLMLGGIAPGSTVYLYFIDENNTPSEGYAVTIPTGHPVVRILPFTSQGKILRVTQ